MTEKNKGPALLPIFLTVFLDLVGFGIIIPVIAELLLNPGAGILPANMDMGKKLILLGFLQASYPLAQFFGAPLLGAMSDRFGRKKVLIISLIGTCIGYIIFAWGITQQSLLVLFLSRALDGFTGGNISIIQSTISDISDPKTRTKNFGLIGMAFGLGFILGPYIGGKFSDIQFVDHINDFSGLGLNNFATPFWFAAILSILNIIFVVYQFKESLVERKSSELSIFTGFSNIGKAFRIANLRTLFLIGFLLALGFNFYTSFFNVYLKQKFDYNQTQTGNFFAFIGLCSALAQGFITRPVAKWFKPYQILRFSLLALPVGIACQIFPVKDYQLFYAVPFIAIAQALTMPNISTLISMQAGPKAQGEIFGINQSVSSVAFAFPPIIAGFFTHLNMYMPLITGAGIILLSWILFVLLWKKNQKSHFE